MRVFGSDCFNVCMCAVLEEWDTRKLLCTTLYSTLLRLLLSSYCFVTYSASSSVSHTFHFIHNFLHPIYDEK